MADPDFNSRGKARDDLREAPGLVSTALLPGPPLIRGNGGCTANDFPSLPYSAEEAALIVKTLQETGHFEIRLYRGGEAREELLKEITAAPRIIHLATHGYFCDDIGAAQDRGFENPLLRSGLALAGANRSIGEQSKHRLMAEDGILTALEVSGLNLFGTEVTVLSSCETGVGDIENGEGVLGLRHAFQAAGTQALIMSLWQVPDKETSQLMGGFYQGWLRGQSKKEALRQSMLDVLNTSRRRNGTAHPFFWGAFVLTGNPD
jgi:CHAT domain-containing protein